MSCKEKYEKVRSLIDCNKDLVDFADFGEGTSLDWIEKAEKAIGVTFPPSYRWWLQNYKGGQIGGEEIYSIYETDFDSVVGGDIVFRYRRDHLDGFLKPTQIAICDSDIDACFYMETAIRDEMGECPIMSSVTEQEYAADFLDFLMKRIALYEE